MEYTKEFMESLPTPKYKFNQNVLVVRGGEIEVRQVTGIYIDIVSQCVRYKISCCEGLIHEKHLFSTPQEMADAITSVFGFDEHKELVGDWRFMKKQF